MGERILSTRDDKDLATSSTAWSAKSIRSFRIRPSSAGKKLCAYSDGHGLAPEKARVLGEGEKRGELVGRDCLGRDQLVAQLHKGGDVRRAARVFAAAKNAHP